nr:hypothetical protein [Streptomyces griseolus]
MNFITFSCSMGSLSAMTAVAEADPLGEPVERLDLVGRRGHPPAQRRVGEVAQELDGADHTADPAEGGVGGVLPRPRPQPLEQCGGGDGALAHGDGHAHQVAELGLDQVEVDDVLARLTEQSVDVHVLRGLGGSVEGQFLPVPDVPCPLGSLATPGASTRMQGRVDGSSGFLKYLPPC